VTNGRVIYPADPSSEFYTSRRTRELAWRVLGDEPTFDPCTSARNPLRALRFRTRAQNRGRVLIPSEWIAIARATPRPTFWMNCPYGKNADGTARVIGWLDAFALFNASLPHHALQALLLMPARPGAGWYEALTRGCQLRCELTGRERFEDRRGNPLRDSARWGAALFYFGNEVARARKLLDAAGVVTTHTRVPRPRPQPVADPRQLALVR
jgi:hypothetical protein